MNSFIDTFLEIIIEALKQMNTELKEKSQLLVMARMKLEGDPKLKEMPKIYGEIMFVLAQNHFFDTTSGLTVGELVDTFEKSSATIRKIL